MDYESSRSVYAQNGSANRRSSQETQPSQTEVPTWEEKPRSLKDLVIRGKYPCIVKVNSSVVKKYMGHTTGGDGTHGVAEEVLHVIELRRHKMVVGTKLHWERMTSDYTRTDKHFQINVAQKGWFEVLPENGQPVEYFDTIHAIVGLRCKQFLVRTSLVGYQLSSENGVSSWVPLEIRPGEILTTGIIHMDQKKTKKKTLFRRLFSWSNNSDKKEKELKYLQCFDSEHREIMVPLIMTGVFSPVGEPTSTNYDAVYSLHDLISAFNLPLKVQLIHTDAHSAGAIPSGVVLLERLQDNDSVLVSTHPYDENVTPTFEIPLNDDIQVFKEKIKKSKTQSIVSNSNVALIENGDDVVDNIQINLPIRIQRA
ncbi:hypothetical protein DPMN_074038 [Dreissena polymorpha]|uniref:CABIT domain-containing protein n=1 Tax=Dreissena polymorpha TaxID=45954 RepID=A0A9D3YHW0_DREPO|nr:hypothetical protein DPMN_074038 [Dreissena polymorpha]